MARGFESKQVESQQEDAARRGTTGVALSETDSERLDRRRTLELSRARLTAELRRATVPAHRQMLEQALDAVDRQLQELTP